MVMKKGRGRDFFRRSDIEVVVRSFDERRGRDVARFGGRKVRHTNDSVDKRGEGVCCRRAYICDQDALLHETQ